VKISVVDVRVVAIASGNEGNTTRSCYPSDGVDDALIFWQMVILYLKEVSITEDVGVLIYYTILRLRCTVHYRLRQLTTQASAQADQAIVVLREQLLVDAWLEVEALGVSERRQLDEVVPADLILCEKNQMVVLALAVERTSFFVCPMPRRDVDFATKYGLHTVLVACALELERATQRSVIRQRYGVLAIRSSDLRDLIFSREAVKD
jgi:hypothetical protein